MVTCIKHSFMVVTITCYQSCCNTERARTKGRQWETTGDNGKHGETRTCMEHTPASFKPEAGKRSKYHGSTNNSVRIRAQTNTYVSAQSLSIRYPRTGASVRVGASVVVKSGCVDGGGDGDGDVVTSGSGVGVSSTSGVVVGVVVVVVVSAVGHA
jgi:hypothetical protein